MTLARALQRREVIMTFKILTGRSPQYLEKLFFNKSKRQLQLKKQSN